MEKQKTKTLIRVVTITSALILITLGFGLGYLSSKKSECEANPLTYGIKKMEKINSANFSCSCLSLDQNIKPFYFDDNNISQQPPLLFVVNKSIGS